MKHVAEIQFFFILTTISELNPATIRGQLGKFNLSTYLFLDDQAVLLRAPIEVVYVPEKQPQATSRVSTSPGIRAPIMSKTTWPKQSPIAAVHPQIRVKGEKSKGK